MIESGIILIDKPAGITSFDVIRKLRKITGIRKMGHTGTLDPFASGLLIICLNKATRLATKIIAENKEYSATLRLGVKTDTGDITGNVLSRNCSERLSRKKIKELIPEIIALKRQIPPRFSALKINGKKAYELARKNQEFVIGSRAVRIYDFNIEKVDLPEVSYRTTVSKGTYIRSLSEQIGAMLDSDATTIQLRRLKIGAISVTESIKLDDLDQNNWEDKLYPLINMFTEIPKIEITDNELVDYKNGRFIKTDMRVEGELIVIKRNRLLGFGFIQEGLLRPRTVIV